MLDVISGGRLVAGFPVGTPMDTNFCYGQIPALTRDKYGEAHDLIMKAWARGRAVRVRRQVQPAPLGELLAQADPEAAPAHLHPGRRLDRDVGLLPRPRLQLLVPLVLRLHARQVAARRLLGAGGQARQGRLALPRRLRPDHLRGRHRRGGRGALRRALPLLLQPVPARVPALRGPAGLPHREHHQVRRALAAPHGGAADHAGPHLEAARGGALHHRGQPGDGAPAARGVHHRPARSATSSACSTPATCRTGRPATPPSSSPRRSCRTCATSGPNGSDDDRWWIHPMEERLHPEETRPGAEKPGQEWR